MLKRSSGRNSRWWWLVEGGDGGGGGKKDYKWRGIYNKWWLWGRVDEGEGVVCVYFK